MKEKAVEYFMNGYSCSESVVKAAIEEGQCPPSILSCATPFSGGMSSGCLCGAVAGAQLVLGCNFGRDNEAGNEVCAREKAAELIQEFKNRNKITCCKALSGGLSGIERKQRCSKYVADACETLEQLLNSESPQLLISENKQPKVKV